MPPDGYNTVTLSVELCDELDDLTDMSRAATVGMLLAEYKSDTPDDAPEVVDARIVDMDASERRKFAEEIGEVLR